jgi:MFS family permease
VGLDCLNFLIGSIQTSLGTFVAFYLADLGWSKESVGLALATGQIAGVLGQIPGGAITDATPWKRGFTAVGILMSMGTALILAIAPLFALVFVAQALDGLTDAIVTPAVAAISLGLVGRRAMSSRTGRNFRFAAAGIAVTALAQGLIGSPEAARQCKSNAFGLSKPLLALSVPYMSARPQSELPGQWRASCGV